jgi:hypothetical protein
MVLFWLDTIKMNTPPPPSLERIVTQRSEYHHAVAQLLSEATETIAWMDADFADCGLASAESVNLLKQFLRDSRKRRLRLLMADDRFLTAHAPRFKRLIDLHSEQIQCRLLQPGQWQGQSILLVDARHVLTRPQPLQWRGTYALDAVVQAEQLAAKFDFLWHESGPCLPPTTLGL